jgi:hypothetical protein
MDAPDFLQYFTCGFLIYSSADSLALTDEPSLQRYDYPASPRGCR